MVDTSAILREFNFLKENPQFEQRPPSILEFLGPDYLNIIKTVRPGIRNALVDIFGKEVSPHVISRARRAIVSGGIGVGKQLDPDCPVLTARGWMPISILLEGDEVFGRDGFLYKVTGVHHWENIERYKITFKDGTSINAGADHLWTVMRKGASGVAIEETLDTKTLAGRNLRVGDAYKYWIPLVEPVEFPKQDLPIPPWLLGAMIANGSMTNDTPTVSTDDMWVGDKIRELLPDAVVKYYDRRFAISYLGARRQDSNPIQAAIRALELGVTARNKFIPRMYLEGDPEDRLELLRGLMDNDGSSCGNNRSDFSTSSQRLAKDVAELVRSLGGYCTVTTFERRGAIEHQVHVNMDQVCPFSMPRKVARWKPRTNQMPKRSIVSIERIENGPGVCISVDAPDKLYVAKDYIVTHNTTASAIIIPYMVCWVECLKDPQSYFDLMPGSRIAFMMMSTSNTQAKEVLFGDIKARIAHSPWFQAHCVPDPAFKNQLRFPKDIWVLPGNSQETSFEGYNILGGILDEGDSHKQTRDKDYAQAGWDTIHARIDSRFNDPVVGDHRGLLVAVGQMKKATGFMAKKRKELLADQYGSVTVMSIWESLGWARFTDEEGNRKSFWYDPTRKRIVPSVIAASLGTDSFIEIPTSYRASFENNPEKALRDLAGIPPAADQPFISLVDRIDECVERWEESHQLPDGTVPVPVSSDPSHPVLDPSVRAVESLRRAAHIDIAISGEGDALGLAMGHVPYLVDIDGELKPYIVFDFLMRIKAMPGTEIFLGDVRKIIYELKDERDFRLRVVTLDGFQSSDTMQQLRKRRIATDYLSVDKDLTPYYDLREAIYERRLEFPRYMTYLKKGDTDKVEIATKELRELSEVGHKVDHPSEGSKDVADAMAAVVFTLMGDKVYRRVAHGARDGYGERRKSEEDSTASLSPLSFEDPLARHSGSLLSPEMPGVPSLSEWLGSTGLPY